MSWLDFTHLFLSNQRLHAWSWINRTSLGTGFFWWFFGFCVFGLFLFCFLFDARRASHRRTGFWLAIKGGRPFQVVVSFPFCLFIWWQFCIVQILSGQKTFLHISSDFFRSLIRSFLSFLFLLLFTFSHSLIRNFLSFLFAFSHSLIGNFPSFLILLSPWLEIFLLSFSFFFCFRG